MNIFSRTSTRIYGSSLIPYDGSETCSCRSITAPDIHSLSSRAKYPLEASSRCDPAEPDRQEKFPYYFGLG